MLIEKRRITDLKLAHYNSRKSTKEQEQHSSESKKIRYIDYLKKIVKNVDSKF